VINSLSAPLLFDRQLLRQRRSRLSVGSINKTRLYKYLRDELTDRLSLIKRSFENVLILGDYTPPSTLAFRNCLQISLTGAANPIIFDDEFLPFGQAKFDLIISFMEMHYFNDIPGFLQQVKYSLQPDGFFMGVMLGQDTLWQLSQATQIAEEKVRGGVSPRVAPMIKLSDAAALMQRAGFALPVVDMDRLQINYATSYELLIDLKTMGLTNIQCERSKILCQKAFLNYLNSFYQEHFTEVDKVVATFTAVYLSGWKPSNSQPKALKRGSAASNLIDFLK